ncbi:MAG: DUF4437 domain-containing protein [Geitlerinemataceae cyanobacterium]
MKTFFAFVFTSIAIAVGLNLALPTDSAALSPAPLHSSIVVRVADVTWEQLNPARGDLSPQAANLWGSRTEPGPAGFLLKPVDGFRSPPHIHNVAYRGVAIAGELHNDDPNAEDMFMPLGSFWTQPAGGVHITAAKGEDALAYIEVEDDFGVQPADEAFESDERPVNVDVTNLIWLDASTTDWVKGANRPSRIGSAEIAFLWGNPQEADTDSQLNGTLVKLPAGFSGTIHSQGATFRAIVIQGKPQYGAYYSDETQPLEPGSYFGSIGESIHRVSAEEESVIYVRVNGTFEVAPDWR